MTTCPQCGRVADDEVVCADCGMSLALTRRMAAVQAAQATAVVAPAGGLMDEFAPDEPEDDHPDRDVNVLRLAAIVCITCLVAAAIAVLLLRQDGSSPKHAALPFSTSSGAGSGAASTANAGPASGRTSTTTAAGPSPSPSSSPSRTKSRSASPSPSPSRSRTSLASATRTVRVAKGAADADCGPHCYRLVVTLSAFPGGTHHISCVALRGGVFGTYTTSSTTSSGCSYRRPNDSVWAVVDNTYRSSTLNW
jgi:hypothetical protein